MLWGTASPHTLYGSGKFRTCTASKKGERILRPEAGHRAGLHVCVAIHYINITGEIGQASGQLCLARSANQRNTKISQSTWQAIRQRATPANIKQRPDKIIRMEQEGVQNATLQAVVQVKQMYAAPTIEISGVKTSAEGKAAVGDEEEARPESKAYPNPGIWVTIKSKY